MKNNILLKGILTISFAVMIAVSAIAQSVMTPEHVAKTQQVGAVYLSADGEYAVYTLIVPADPLKENAPASSHLYLLDMETLESKPFVTGISVGGVAFRPGHESITFLARKEGDAKRSLYEISLKGGEAQKLFEFSENISSYSWGSDGDHIVFQALEPAQESKNPLPYQPEVYEEGLRNTWAYMQNVSKEGHTPHRIELEGSVSQTSWSPDLSKVVVALSPTSLVDDTFMAQEIFVIDHETREVISQVEHEGKLGAIVWSPDSKKLAMIAAANINDPIDGRLKIADAMTGESTIIFENFLGKFEQLKWKDNNSLYYLASKGVWSELGALRADGSKMDVMIPTGGTMLNAFVESNGTFLFDAENPMHPDEVYIKKRRDREPKRVTNVNPWLDELELGRQEVVTYTAEDGMEIEGLLIYPVDYQEGTRYPLINVIHGGPEAHYDNGWLTAYSMAGQVAAGDGFAVFYPNYRGSTGRGLEFAMSSQGDLAGAEFDDIVEGVDHLIDLGIVDRDKVGVTGGSYGGYATAWMSTRYSDRFAAGVMFVGISNNLSKWGTSDIPEELYLVHSRKRLWDDYQGYLERSPIYYVDQAKTPLLIMHGKEDTRVDPGQSYELYRHIKTRTDTPVRLVLYPGEGHGNRRATAQYDYNLRAMRWFNEYLKGDAERPDMELQIESRTVDN
ncbi:MAG: S9 family peptidase [Balneolaceae bacterium]|nr:S9 family peptidase [Balneolaceae bacterium]